MSYTAKNTIQYLRTVEECNAAILIAEVYQGLALTKCRRIKILSILLDIPFSLYSLKHGQLLWSSIYGTDFGSALGKSIYLSSSELSSSFICLH